MYHFELTASVGRKMKTQFSMRFTFCPYLNTFSVEKICVFGVGGGWEGSWFHRDITSLHLSSVNDLWHNTQPGPYCHPVVVLINKSTIHNLQCPLGVLSLDLQTFNQQRTENTDLISLWRSCLSYSWIVNACFTSNYWQFVNNCGCWSSHGHVHLSWLPLFLIIFPSYFLILQIVQDIDEQGCEPEADRPLVPPRQDAPARGVKANRTWRQHQAWLFLWAEMMQKQS